MQSHCSSEPVAGCALYCRQICIMLWLAYKARHADPSVVLKTLTACCWILFWYHTAFRAHTAVFRIYRTVRALLKLVFVKLCKRFCCPSLDVYKEYAAPSSLILLDMRYSATRLLRRISSCTWLRYECTWIRGNRSLLACL